MYITYPITNLCQGIVLTLIAAPELALLGGGASTPTGGGAQLLLRTGHITFVECDRERNAGFGREGQRTTDQLKLGSSTQSMSTCT